MCRHRLRRCVPMTQAYGYTPSSNTLVVRLLRLAKHKVASISSVWTSAPWRNGVMRRPKIVPPRPGSFTPRTSGPTLVGLTPSSAGGSPPLRMEVPFGMPVRDVFDIIHLWYSHCHVYRKGSSPRPSIGPSIGVSFGIHLYRHPHVVPA